MSDRQEDPKTTSEKGAEQSSPVNNGESFKRAANVIAAGTEDRSERSHDALARMEDRAAGAQLSNQADDSDAVTRRLTGDEHGDDDKLDHALADKALEEGVAAANDSAHIEKALSPHAI